MATSNHCLLKASYSGLTIRKERSKSSLPVFLKSRGEKKKEILKSE